MKDLQLLNRESHLEVEIFSTLELILTQVPEVSSNAPIKER